MMILSANSKTKLVLSESSQYSEREYLIRQHYHETVGEQKTPCVA
jgi:hypothetical protein